MTQMTLPVRFRRRRRIATAAVLNRIDGVRVLVRLALRRPVCGHPNYSPLLPLTCDRHPGHRGNHKCRRILVRPRTWLGNAVRALRPLPRPA